MTDNADDLIDYETTDILLDTLEDEFLDVVHEFIRSGDNLSAKLKQQVDQNNYDIDALIALTHTLKGASGNIGAKLLSEICTSLEHELHKNQVDMISAHVSQIERVYSKTKDEYLRVFKKAS